MESLIGILLDVSGSMSCSIGKGTDEEGGPWARSIFEVIDNLIKYDVSSKNHVFAIGFGASCGEEVFDIIGTLKQIPNQDNAVQAPATPDHINEIFCELDGAGARSVRKWAAVEVVSEALTDNLAEVFLNKFKSDQPFLQAFVEKCLPPACRDWITTSDVLWKLTVRSANSAYATVATTFRTATVADVKEVVEKAKAYLLKKVDVDSIFNVQDASAVVHGCVDEKKLTKKRSQELLRSVKPYIYGYTPLYQSLEKAIELFETKATKFRNHKKLLFILSDGYPSDEDVSDPARKDRALSKLTTAGVTVVSCFITDFTQIEPKRLFSKMERDWDRGAKFLFSLSSKVLTQSLPRTIFLNQQWHIEIDNNETHLFLQVNHPDHLRDACKLARDFVCCKDTLSDVLSTIDLDIFHINQDLKGYEAKEEQIGATCYAHACATVLHLSMKRILGREGGHPSFQDLKYEIMGRFGTDGADPLQVLQKMCRDYRLQCREVDINDALKAVSSSQPVVASFWLTKDEMKTFQEFFDNETNRTSILTKNEIDIAARPANTPTEGHSVVLTSFDSESLRLLNSWGCQWADMGFFRVQNEDVLGLEFIEVYWEEDDLKEEEKAYFKKHGSTVARKLMKSYSSLKDAQYTCPVADCSKRSPVVEFTGTLTHVKCPKCGNEFSTKDAQEGNILALNIYLTSLSR
ncbi:uncharacterized protein [Porites lutea]|uniref:uncharacterized protein n=1 Tax=Porites lutea TaxID=51062 RepID=UPI003CC6BC2C